MLAVPGNTLLRDLETAPPAYSGRGRRPQRPWQRIDQWSTALPRDAWTPIDVRDGAKGPLVVEMVKGPVVAQTPQRQEGHQEMAVVVRYRDRDQQEVVQVDGYLSNGAVETSLATFARVAKANIALKHACSAARVKPAWRSMRYAIGRAGIIIKRFR